MNRLLGDPPLRKRLGQAGRKWATQFTWDRTAQAQEQNLSESCHITTAIKNLLDRGFKHAAMTAFMELC